MRLRPDGVGLKTETWLGAVLGVLLVLLLMISGESLDVGEIVSGPLRLFVAMIPAAILLTSLHEAAHATVGRLLGWRVYGVTLGHGPRIARLHLGSFRLELRGLVIGGVTIAKATGTRWRDAAMLLAGVSVESVAIAVALVWSPDSAWAQSARWAIILVACIDIAANLWPRRVDIGHVAGMATDGAQLVTVFTALDQWRHDHEQMDLTRDRARIIQTLHGGDVDEALRLARAEAAADPTDEAAATLAGTLLLLRGEWRAAFDQLVPHAAADDADPMLANNTAWAAVMTFDPALLAPADRLSQRALAGRPDEPACANTRGSTLTLLGRADEGLVLMNRAASGQLSKKQKAFVLGFSALASHRLRRFDEAQAHLSAAAALDAECPALPRIRGLMMVNDAGAWPPPEAGDRVG